MSHVCRKWSEGFTSQSVWKKLRFSLTESQLSMDPCPNIKCAEKYSRMFRHVEIVCIRNVDERLIETWFRRLIVFLDILTRNSQLISLKVRWPEIGVILDTINCEEDVKKAIASFLKSQHHWERVEFHSRYFLFPFKQDRKLPVHFVLRRFVNNIEPMDQESSAVAQGLHTFLCQKHQIFQEIPLLQSDYSFIHESMSASQSADKDKLRSSQPKKTIFQCYGSIQSHF
ncbi:hypothetical protein AVEN_28211-1 [Araneus ventricosus]|uniref:F-box domain-containing protein n=1 Tax=Araneus ventricosus TaxID=182803 RepID=A0A4Y2EYD1_ARAVE|nr:hypothetical protein AVEN_28211-1 [Araneus ventricosus]